MPSTATLDFESPVIHNWIPHDVAEVVIGGEAEALRHKRSAAMSNPETATATEFFRRRYVEFLEVN